LLSIAHGIQDFQMIGGPAWIDSDAFDITAKIPNGTGAGAECGDRGV